MSLAEAIASIKQCQRNWADLERDWLQPDSRHCSHCNKRVHLCFTPADFRWHTSERHCVALVVENRVFAADGRLKPPGSDDFGEEMQVWFGEAPVTPYQLGGPLAWDDDSAALPAG